MKHSADCVSYSGLKQGRGSHYPLTGIVHVVSKYTEKLIFFSPSRISCVHLFLHFLLLFSVSLLRIFTVHAMERDGGLQ